MHGAENLCKVYRPVWKNLKCASYNAARAVRLPVYTNVTKYCKQN